MNHIAIANHASALAYLAEMEAMKVENEARRVEGFAMAYSEEDFLYIAKQLHDLAQNTLQDGWQQ